MCSIGSSILDLSVVNINGGVIEVVATGGNTTLGKPTLGQIQAFGNGVGCMNNC